MKKVRTLVSMTAVVPAAVTAAVAPTVANAATANRSADHGTARTGKAVSFGSHFKAAATAVTTWASIINGPAPLWTPSNKIHTHLNNGSGNSVFITCYYTGNTGFGDQYWDHFTKYNKSHFTHTFTGHVADHYVNLLGHNPKSYGIPHC